MLSPAKVTAEQARLLLLHAQGLLDDPARRATPAALTTLIERMGFVQIDSINVVERAHHLTLTARMDSYRPEMLATITEHKRSLFEHWTHDASAIPVKWFPHWKHRFERSRKRIEANRWWRKRIGPDPQRIIDLVLERIESEGPLMSADFAHDRNGEAGGWWEWKPQKAALEYLWHTGSLSVARRVNFHKVYDLTERVLPHVCSLPAPEIESHVEWACRTAMERLGVATPSEIAAFWSAIKSPSVRQWCDAAAKHGEIVPVRVESLDGSKPRLAFAPFDWDKRLQRVPDPPQRIRLLSPFDPILRDRKRALRLFGFDYTFEAFVPEPKRRYGYYVMPLLEGDRLVGRADVKFHRDQGVLEARGVWWERGVRVTKIRLRMFGEAMERLAVLVDANNVVITRSREAASGVRHR